jgi:hypothetical protein
MTLNLGWKLTRVDGTAHNGFEWPLGTPEAPVALTAPEARAGGACPSFEGDGFCVALTAQGACSGGLSLANSQALWLAYEDGDVLGRDDNKVRVRRVEVIGRFDPIAALVRGASGADLRDANLSGANLSGANLYAADLRAANLSAADLCAAIGVKT